VKRRKKSEKSGNLGRRGMKKSISCPLVGSYKKRGNPSLALKKGGAKMIKQLTKKGGIKKGGQVGGKRDGKGLKKGRVLKLGGGRKGKKFDNVKKKKR